jgi:hypothetical protein
MRPVNVLEGIITVALRASILYQSVPVHSLSSVRIKMSDDLLLLHIADNIIERWEYGMAV